ARARIGQLKDGQTVPLHSWKRFGISRSHDAGPLFGGRRPEATDPGGQVATKPALRASFCGLRRAGGVLLPRCVARTRDEGGCRRAPVKVRVRRIGALLAEPTRVLACRLNRSLTFRGSPIRFPNSGL